MKKNIHKFMAFVILILISDLAFAQTNQVKAADKLFDSYLYSQAIEAYEVIKTKDENVCRKLADSYRLTSNPTMAEKYYEALFGLGNTTVDDIWNYAEVLKMNKKYPEALAKIDQYNKMKPGEKRAEYSLLDNTYYLKLMADSTRFKVLDLAFNTEYSEYAPTYYNAQIVFVSSRPIYSWGEYNDGWTDKRFTNLFGSYDDKTKEGMPTLSHVREVIVRGTLAKKFHEGPASFSADGFTMVFTRNSYLKDKQLDSTKKERVLELWMSKLDWDGTWRNPVPLPFNNLTYNVGHPTIAPDEKTLFFISDMPGGYGGTDIYKCTMTADGVFGPAINLGDQINTEGDEMYPFIHEKGLLFFASNGHAGLGGLDLFYTKVSDNKITKVANLGGSINSSMDDYGLIMDISMKRGFFSSNRSSGKGSDDIYGFNVLKPFTFNKAIAGVVKDKESGEPLNGATVKLFDTKGNVMAETVTSEAGSYSFEIEPNLDFSVVGNNANYKEAKKTGTSKTEDELIKIDLILEKMLSISIACLVTDNKSKSALDSVSLTITDKFSNKLLFEGVTDSEGKWRHVLEKTMMNTRVSYVIKLNRPGYLEKTIEWSYNIYKEEEIKMHEFMDFTMAKLEVGIDLGKVLGLKPIYFDRGKWDIKPVAAIELEKIVVAMKLQPEMVISLGAHTDCRSSADANITLSQKRAESCVNYIVSQGIELHRITPHGYGETKLLNDCACEGDVKSKCTEEEHSINRRIEFIVDKY